ncbi:DUF4185 domain-containing protein [Candidatus Saccharibacteria bacterium]|nr:DUF4185 domain-containing protein [Candidatus Saccharibacteria bacterium]
MFRQLVSTLVALAAILILGLAVSTSALSEPPHWGQSPPKPNMPPLLTRLTGADIEATSRFGSDSTDLMIPFNLPGGNVGFLGGDTFDTATPGVGNWRSPILLRSNQTPVPGKALHFDSAAGLDGYGLAPEIMYNGHKNNGEYTVIPTDGISFPETGNVIVSYMSLHSWWPTDDHAWANNYSGLAWSPDGNYFYRIGPTWPNNPDKNNSPYQVMSMQRDGDFVYIVSVRAGRQPSTDTPMMLQRVSWDNMLDKTAYQCWAGKNVFDNIWSSDYASCSPILQGSFGEPSLRKLSDGKTWAMSYLDTSSPESPSIVTRAAASPIGPWSVPKIQLTWDQNPFLYGGFIHPRSTPNNLLLMVSTWVPVDSGLAPRYDVSLLKSTV